MLIAGLSVRLTSRGPVIFKQERVGMGGETFDIFKFRTMTDRSRSGHVELLGSHPEFTAIGRVLRRTKIDELPQLVNVLMGQMSLVGPRPDLPSATSSYSDVGWRRREVRPGLTGLSQTSGNIHLSWPDRWEYDAQYVEDMSLRLDLALLGRTALVVLVGEERFVRRPES